ncbi:AMP-binding enzyme-like protein 3 [Elsinoe fawcettii]|nr:AMP-binding enzyme-like protein 3 [Elsinoe fawcettii]
MVFTPPSWVPALPEHIPDDITLAEFMYDEKHGRYPIAKSRHPFTCGLTGKSYTHAQVFERSELLAKALSKRLDWSPHRHSPWDKVVCIFSLNSIDYMTVAYGTHRLSGIVSPANAVYSVDELAHQLQSSASKALFTCGPLLSISVMAATKTGIPSNRIFLLELPNTNTPSGFLTLDDLLLEGRNIPVVPTLRFKPQQGAQQTAFLCYSSGTSGLPVCFPRIPTGKGLPSIKKAVMISHHNIIANIVQHSTYDTLGRRTQGVETQNLLAPLPMSHIYALVVAAHTNTWRGDGFVILPKYEFEHFLNAIQRFQVQQVLVVPPILIQMLADPKTCAKYDLSSLRFMFSGAAPLGEETIRDLQTRYPTWKIGQAYGMTETAVVVTAPSEHDIVQRAAGSLLPGFKIKLISPDGAEVFDHGTPGEVYVQGPSVTLGYHNDLKATSATFVEFDDGRWVRTGDEGVMINGPSGHEQLVITDRIKELIKVSGHQVAPAELEAHILRHTSVSDVAVIQVPDDRSGEVPKAFVVRSEGVRPRHEVANEILAWVADHKAPYKRLRGGIEFVACIPKSPSGKILRRVLRDRNLARPIATFSRL